MTGPDDVGRPNDEATSEADAALTRAVLRALARGGAGKKWQEIAQGVLDEDVTLRQMASSEQYGELFGDGLRGLLEHRDRIGEASAEAERRAAAEVLAELHEQLRRDDEDR